MKHIKLNSLVAIVLLSGCVLHKIDGQDADFSVNVAYGKPATQSSTYLGNTLYKEPNQFPYNASLAVDGITTTNFYNGSCSHTAVDQDYPWWEVDLQGLYDVSSIKIYQRSDANQRGLDGFVVRGMQNDANYLTIDHSGLYALGEIDISLQPKRQFKAIRIQIDRNNAFICLCEVEVFAEVNVALRKPAVQSSTYDGTGNEHGHYVASLAVDGNTETQFSYGSCSKTIPNEISLSWWKVILNGRFPVIGLRIYQRSDQNQDWLDGYRVSGRQGEGIYENIPTPRYTNGLITLTLSPVKLFSEIKIELNGNGTKGICLCEVQVFAGIDKCVHPTTCHNHGQCFNSDRGYSCYCNTGYTGTTCETDIDECTTIAEVCHNHGQCSNIDGGFSCRCDTGYTGTHCDSDIDECTTIAAACHNHGQCSNTDGGFSCHCDTSYTGTHCESDIDECRTIATACHNHGQCSNTDGGFSCHCDTGYTGIHCESDIDECTMIAPACHNHGHCSNIDGGFSCDCDTGYTGAHCESDINDCATIGTACHNHGVCSNTDGGFSCRCNTGYTGYRCESDIDECATMGTACHNHGVCFNTDGGFSCRCDTGYTGYRCESDIHDCATMETSCYNHGVCSNTDGGFSCRCYTGYTGDRCESDIDECTTMTTACHNHGQCSNTDGGFSCRCDTGYTGTRCESGIPCHIPDIDSKKAIYELHPVLGGNVSYTSYLTMKCKEGYRLLGSNIIRCTSIGEWDTSIGQCTVIQCSGRFILPNNSMHLYKEGIEGNLSYNSTISIRCKEGYKVSGPDLIRCNEFGAWDRQFGTCPVIDCGWPEDVPHDVQVLIMSGIAGGFSYNATACIQSNEELKKVGNIYESLRCSSDGSWRGNLGKCFETTKKEAYMDQDGQKITLPIAILLPICLILIATNFVTLLKHRRHTCYRGQPSEQFQVDMTIADHFGSSQNGITKREQTRLSHSNGDIELETIKSGSEETHSHDTGPYDELQNDHGENSEYDELKFKRDL